MKGYQTERDFTEGYAACIVCSFRDTSKSKHWLAGWDAGYPARAERNRKLDEYLVSIGRGPQRIVKLAASPKEPS